MNATATVGRRFTLLLSSVALKSETCCCKGAQTSIQKTRPVRLRWPVQAVILRQFSLFREFWVSQ